MQTAVQHGIAVAWEMDRYSRLALGRLPAVVRLWRVRDDETSSIYYLTKMRAIDGMAALAQSATLSVIECVAVLREHVIAIDLDRLAAQVVFVVPEAAAE